MNDSRREQIQADMVMVMVVPVKEGARPGTGILHTAEAIRVGGMVLEGLEVGFAEGIVVQDIRSGMAFVDAQIAEQQCQGFGFHWLAIVGMEGQLVGLDLLVGGSGGDELAGPVRRSRARRSSSRRCSG